MIGTARLEGGMYKLTSPSVITNSVFALDISNKVVNAQNILHYRLGHISYPRIKMLESKVSSICTPKDLICDTCHFAKQKRLPFPISTSVTTKCF